MAQSSSAISRIVLVDATSNSLTISWTKQPDINNYILQYRTSKSPINEYKTLSENLTSTEARKKNLQHEDSPFLFRVSTDGVTWISHEEESLSLLQENEEQIRMDPPEVIDTGGNYSVSLKWTQFESPSVSQVLKGYELQMREASIGGSPWNTIAGCVKGMEARKRNLKTCDQYQFRVRPVFDTTSDAVPFSSPSDGCTVRSISLGMERLFSGLPRKELLSKEGNVNVGTALSGKVVLLYASAHWCGPCRQYTPELARFYKTNKADVEIIFLSCDHDEKGFLSYFSSMPWKSIPYECDLREKLLAWIKVTGIPRLVVLNSRGGTLVDNAVGKKMDVARWKMDQK